MNKEEDTAVKRAEWGKLEVKKEGMTERGSVTACFEKTQVLANMDLVPCDKNEFASGTGALKEKLTPSLYEKKLGNWLLGCFSTEAAHPSADMEVSNVQGGNRKRPELLLSPSRKQILSCWNCSVPFTPFYTNSFVLKFYS